MEIKIQVEGDKIKSVSKSDTAAGNLNSYRCSFSFDGVWDSLTKVAAFIRNDTYFNVPLSENCCAVPREVMEAPGNVHIGVFGFDKAEDTSVRISAVPKMLDVLSGSFSAESVEPKEGELSLWEQYVKAAQEAAAAAQEAAVNVKSTIETELAAAKESGMFDGADGQDGAPGQDGADGKDGKDGVSCTHEWDGTVLKVTSASGTSEADLKGPQGEQGPPGEKGDKGDTGSQGPQGEQGAAGADGQDGADGYTPVRGVDFWTEEDKAEMIEELTLEAISKTADVWNLEHNKHYEITVPYQSSSNTYQLYFIIDPATMPDVFECSAYVEPVSEAPYVFVKNTAVTGSDFPLLWFGDDCDETGTFTPQANTHYEIHFKRVGTDESGNPLIIARVGAWQ